MAHYELIRWVFLALLVVGSIANPAEYHKPPTTKNLIQTKFCSPDRCPEPPCGQSLRSDELRRREAIERDRQPAPCKWAEHDNYDNQDLFMPNEAYRGLRTDETTRSQKVVPLPSDGKTSSEVVTFGDEPASLAVPHLLGCTSVIVVSNRGAWANHIWELPVFTPELDGEYDDEGDWLPNGKWIDPANQNSVDDFPAESQRAYFKEHALDRLRTPYSTGPGNHASGLDSLRGQGGIFGEGSDPKIFLFLPYARGGNIPLWDHGGAPTPRADEGVDSFNDQIKAELREIFGGGLEFVQVLYRIDDDSDPQDTAWENPYGRALVQYQPGDNTNREGAKAKWRVFFENAREPHATAGEWDPEDGQWCPASASAAASGLVGQRILDVEALRGSV